MDKANSYVFCDHCEQSVSETTFRRHMALKQSRQIKRSLKKDSPTSSSETDGETDCNSCNLKGESVCMKIMSILNI